MQHLIRAVGPAHVLSNFFRPYFAQKLWGKTKVRCQHILRYPLHKLGKQVAEMTVPLFVAHAVNIFDAGLSGGKSTLVYYPEIAFQLGYCLKQFFLFIFADADNFRVFNRLDVAGRWAAAFQAIKIGHPPVFNGKQRSLFVQFFVDEIQADTPFAYKIKFLANMIWFQQEMFFLNRFYTYSRIDQPLVGFG